MDHTLHNKDVEYYFKKIYLTVGTGWAGIASPEGFRLKREPKDNQMVCFFCHWKTKQNKTKPKSKGLTSGSSTGMAPPCTLHVSRCLRGGGGQRSRWLREWDGLVGCKKPSKGRSNISWSLIWWEVRKLLRKCWGLNPGKHMPHCLTGHGEVRQVGSVIANCVPSLLGQCARYHVSCQIGHQQWQFRAWSLRLPRHTSGSMWHCTCRLILLSMQSSWLVHSSFLYPWGGGGGGGLGAWLSW